jgi:hypothetical protein
MSKVKLNLRKVATGVACLAVCMVFSTCGKDGNDGVNGKDGIDGTQGIQGIAGNAGVKMYVYGSKTFTADANYVIPNMTEEELDNSILYSYYYWGNNEDASTIPSWYPAIGLGPYADYEVRSSYFRIKPNVLVYIGLHDPGCSTKYATEVTWEAFKIIVVPIPEGNITEVKSAGKGYPVDWSNYKEVVAYFGLPE